MMKSYITLLRGINVGGRKKIKMDDLRQLLTQIGFEDVVTYIQSGNVVLKSNEKTLGVLEKMIATAIRNTYDFDVPILVKSKEEIQEILENNPFDNAEDLEANRIYFVLLGEVPRSDLVEALMQETFANEKFSITDNCVYLCCDKGYGKAKCDNNFFERKLKVAATTRNYRTMTKLLEMSQV
ncbi:DUF1697 domain-containing protein [Kriegella aquimaris]|uniref:Uncharacterized conserved protein, DUF1697 family n=1 Tax=Kriegella aquimaris TaxID=192904 RepID=A0A1G9MA96_9FLAO|nr:DUF1697 domain-containing protein [Kriegella aquimaris]SDL71044.1 Uncharacterized conserved protein, DUF1697 family [Kriegella aquimaris]